MTTRTEARRSNKKRFQRIASSIPIKGDSLRSYYGHTGAEVFSKFGRRVNSRFAAFFSPLSDDEMAVACNALVQEVVFDGTDIMNANPLRILVDRCVLVRSAEVIAMLSPTFLRIASLDTSYVGTFHKVLNSDRNNTNTPARQWWRRSFPEKRVNWLHGRLMYEVAATSSDDFKVMDAEWFGENRERVIPLWELLVKDGTFNPERVEVLLEYSERGATGVISGAL